MCSASLYLTILALLVTHVELKTILPSSLILLKPECDSLKETCPNLKGKVDDSAVIECVSNIVENSHSAKDFNFACQHEVWMYIASLLQNGNLQEMVKQNCPGEMQPICSSEDPSELLKCLFDSLEVVRKRSCVNFIQRIKMLTFVDWGLMELLMKKCNHDLTNFQCGRVDNDMDSGTGTLACLQSNLTRLSNDCRSQVLYLSELQGENIKLDRQLYISCAEERSQFCRDTPIGSGKIYMCLIQHKRSLYSSRCMEELFRHEKLIIQDFQVSRGLVRSCRDDIHTHRCRKGISDNDKVVKLAQILLCLENVSHNGTHIQKECAMEMLAHRKMLMDDYRLSPELIDACVNDIRDFCDRLEAGGKTIHCLMEHSRMRKWNRKVSDVCQRQLEILIKETDAGEDWRVDPVVWNACRDIASINCGDVEGGDGRVMGCLVGLLGTNHMQVACENALLQVQYFISRDYKLDPRLYKACHDDAVTYCHAKQAWSSLLKSYDPERGPHVLPCLLRMIATDQEEKLKKVCMDELKRIMKQRAMSVELQPEVEVECFDDLVHSCSDKTKRGEEMSCLQDKYETLNERCKVLVGNYTELQSKQIELNPIIATNCKLVVESLCQTEIKFGSGADVLECLIQNKNDPLMRYNNKCRVSVEHHQLISLKDYHFTLKFKEACKNYVSRFCSGAKTKAEVVRCLSEVIRNETINDHKPHISKECRQQLRSQLFQQRENIELNPRLKHACSPDIKKFCPNTTPGNAQVLECLMSNRREKKNLMTPECYKYLFNLGRQDAADSSTDYTLLNTCRTMLLKYCRVSYDQALSCLKKFKYEEGFDHNCKVVVVRRLIEQNSDYRFNPSLYKGCSMEIGKFCSEAIARQSNDSYVEGLVIQCLKTEFKRGLLGSECESEMATFLREAALNYQLNPLIAKMCEKEITLLCHEEEKSDSYGEGRVEECLKKALLSGYSSISKPCRIEIAELLDEAKADIHTDPILHTSCINDINTYCAGISQGAGRILDCITNVYYTKKKMNPDCKRTLETRLEMFKKINNPPEVQNLVDLYGQVSHSPAKKYFILVALTCIGMIFVSGLFCGRYVRRTNLIKNK